MWVFGGLIANGDRTNTIVALNIERGKWSRVATQGTKPRPRANHACFVDGDNMYIHGGDSDVDPSLDGAIVRAESGRPSGSRSKRICLDDMHCLNTRTLKWSRVIIKLSPLPRKSHTICRLQTATPVDKAMLESTGEVSTYAVMFGGAPGGVGEPTSEMFALRLGDIGTWRAMWHKISPTGSPPCARYGHSATAITNDRMLVFGGAVTSGEFLSDTYLFDLSSQSWSRVNTTGRPPHPRHSHTASLVPAAAGKRPPSLLVFGGISCTRGEFHCPRALSVLDLVSSTWSELRVGHLYPSPRYGHSMVCLQSTLEDSPVKIEGGGVGEGEGEEKSEPSTAGTALKSALRMSASAPALGGAMTPVDSSNISSAPALSGKSSVPLGRTVTFGTGRVESGPARFVVFGGMSSKLCNSDVWMLRLRRRRSRFYHGAGGESAVTEAPSSGSDSDDWVEHGDERWGSSTTTMVSKDRPPLVQGPRRILLDDAAPEPSHPSVPEEVELQLLHTRQELSRVERMHAKELEARKALEIKLKRTEEELKATSVRAAHAERTVVDKVANVEQECERRIKVAESRARQARADLQRVVHLLCLHDVASNLRIEMERRQGGAEPTSRPETDPPAVRPESARSYAERSASGEVSSEDRAGPPRAPVSRGIEPTLLSKQDKPAKIRRPIATPSPKRATKPQTSPLPPRI